MKEFIYLLAVISFYLLYGSEWITKNFQVYYFVFALILFALYSLIIEIISSKIQSRNNTKKFVNYHEVAFLKELCTANFPMIMKNRLDNLEFLISGSIQILFPERVGGKIPRSSEFQYITLESFTIFKIENREQDKIHLIFAEVYFSYYDGYHPVMTGPDDKLWEMEHWVFSLNPENIWVLVNTNFESSIHYNLQQLSQKIKKILLLK